MQGSQMLELAGDVQIELLEREGDFVGFGAVTVGGVALRDGARPIVIRLDTPIGILYTRLVIENIERSESGVNIALDAIGLPWGRCEYHDEYGQPLQWLGGDFEPVHDKVVVSLKPVRHELGGRVWQGFSYSIRFDSDVREIHRVQTHATWEIGGRITGNTILSQGQCNMPVYRGSVDALFTTACLKTLAGYGSLQGNSFQLAPRCGLIQGFDFQHAQEGALLQYWPDFKNTSSLVESPPGSDILHLIDEYRFDLSSHAATTAKHVLFSAGGLEEYEARNLWHAAIEEIYGGIRAQAGVSRSISEPIVMMSYQTILDGGQASQVAGQAEWKVEEVADAKRGLRIKLADVEVDHTEMLYAIGDSLLPRLADQGVARFFPDVISESDVTQYGFKRKLDGGVHGDLHCASICATHRFFPSEFWGGIKAWHYLYGKAKDVGLQLGHWFAPHFSPRSSIYAEHPEYQMINANGQPDGGGYGFHGIVVADWNSGIYQRTLDDMKRWQDEGGLDFLFIDSYSNMGLLQVNYSNAMRSNLAAFSRLLSELQGIGIKTITFESITPLGVIHFGVADLRGELVEHNRSVAGQNDFGWWIGEEDMAIDCSLMVAPNQRNAEELAEYQFRTMANRGYLAYNGVYDYRHILPDWWVRANKVYNLVLPYMNRRTLLPGRTGVSWNEGGTEVLWLFNDLALQPGTTKRIERVTEDGFETLDTDTAELKAWQVYRITR